MHVSSGLKGDGMKSGIMMATGLACSEGKMVEQEPEENWVHQGQIYQGDEQLAYDCCDQCN